MTPAPPRRENAPHWRRSFAWIIDFALSVGLMIGLQAFLLWNIRRSPAEACGVDACAMAALSVIVGIPMIAVPLFFVVYAVTEVLGRSPGMWLMSIVIVNQGGGAPGWRGLVRFVVPLAFVMTAAVGYLSVVEATFDGSPWRRIALLVSGLLAVAPYGASLLHRERRTLHDLAAGTWVISG